MQLMFVQPTKELLLWQQPVLVSQVCALERGYIFNMTDTRGLLRQRTNESKQKKNIHQGKDKVVY